MYVVCTQTVMDSQLDDLAADMKPAGPRGHRSVRYYEVPPTITVEQFAIDWFKTNWAFLNWGHFGLRVAKELPAPVAGLLDVVKYKAPAPIAAAPPADSPAPVRVPPAMPAAARPKATPLPEPGPEPVRSSAAPVRPPETPAPAAPREIGEAERRDWQTIAKMVEICGPAVYRMMPPGVRDFRVNQYLNRKTGWSLIVLTGEAIAFRHHPPDGRREARVFPSVFRLVQAFFVTQEVT